MVRKEILKGILAALLFLVWVAAPLEAAKPTEKSGSKNTLAKVSTNDVYRPMDINNIFNYYSNNGDGSFNKFSASNEGFEFPKGSNDGTVIFEDGLVWGGYKNDTLYVGGSTYNHGLQAGKILSVGVADDPGKASYRVYRVRPDMPPASIFPASKQDSVTNAELNALTLSEVSYVDRFEAYSAADLQKQYWDDWNQWPAADGAPYTDVNHNGHYDPAVDVPGIPGADQTIWHVSNDLSVTRTQNLYGSNPIGIEEQRTIWAYNRPGALGNTIFVLYKLINKSGFAIDSMRVSQWADPDLGDAGDDYAGCDTVLSLGFCYNGQARDANYARLNLPPPAVGFDFFQGPIVPSAGDTAIFALKKKPGYRNLKMSAFNFFINANALYADPALNDPRGTPQWWNLMRGLVGNTGQPYTDPNGVVTKFVLAGDPVLNTGWLDGPPLAPPGDRRMALITGPFTMAAGDTQEIVVAALAAQGSDYLSSVSYLKYYDQIAQTAYDYLFDLPSAPPTPQVKVAALDGKIVLSWGDPSASATTENFVSKGYAFQGYNVWQMPTNSTSGAKRIATYDLKSGKGLIQDLAFDPITGYIVTEPVQYGTHSGLKRSITITQDAFTSAPIVNNRDYYFAVTAYSYNGTGVEPNNLESPISGNIQRVRAQSPQSGITATDIGSFSNVVHTGTANASLNVTVVDPYQITGDNYQVVFHNETYSLGQDGKWVDVTALSKKNRLGKDLTGSSLTSAATWSETKGSFDIHYLADVVSIDYDWCDGIQIKLPAGVAIDTVFKPVSNNDGSEISYTLNRTTNTIFFGDSSRSKNGLFAGGEDIVVRVHSASLPMVTHYTMYDDNYGDSLIDVSSTDTLKQIANNIVTQKQWDVKDVTKGTTPLKNQTILSGADIYDQNTYFKANNIFGPGGSAGTNGYNVGVSPVLFDGMTVEVSGSYAAPTTIGKLIVNGTTIRRSSNEYVTADGNFDMADFVIFGFAAGTANASLSSYNGGVTAGATSIDALQQGYELRWTGVTGDTTINGQTVVITKSGGSIATLIGASNYNIKDHPLNPTPGTKAPFTIRIPFEVWNIDKNEQVNLLVYDRNAGKTNIPGDATKQFQVWNTRDRVYVWAVSTKYATAVISPTSQTAKDSATWNWVFFKSNFTTGDKIQFLYNKPLQIGKDNFTFSIPKAQYSSTLAKNEVDQINVFPNPYFGFNKLEADKYTRWVRFTHLPQKATIHIYNLAGILVRTLQKNNADQYFDWNLLNEYQLPVAAGMYIVYIDLPDLGQTKTLKLAIIPEQQFLDHY